MPYEPSHAEILSRIAVGETKLEVLDATLRECMAESKEYRQENRRKITEIHEELLERSAATKALLKVVKIGGAVIAFGLATWKSLVYLEHI